MMMTLTSKLEYKNIYASASVIGQSHIETASSNQDAYIVKEYAFGTVFVVADGLGSNKHSEIGSQAVCKAVCEAARIWTRKEDSPPHLLIRLIHSIWELKIYPYPKKDCGTTCLFAIVLKNKKLVVGQLGDGLVCYSMNNQLYVLNEKADEFGNLTNSISYVRSSNEWNMEIRTIEHQDFVLLLATDGVSEDLIKERRMDYLHYLKDKICHLPSQRTRNLEIKNILNNWVTKHSIDDKTMIIIHRKVELQ